MVRIRLKRMGRKHKPSYRVTAVDSRRSRDGITLEELGYYDPGNKKPELRCKLNLERIQYWLEKGAQPSETVRDLIRKSRAEAAAK
ncbi:MAG TPA: 30S ribosomal protein S16 [Phycisphaerae bacterium]|nr:30S ribosomal protein S16 [Phycisphaerae bacterium]HOJ75898.1 30S ribosomal protein S16 [Phycisphaerae bacterium]HOM52326.1 30S ribosomal protein S16 [Phycisphaerae bacterium]HOQ84650.1 30S ribosomal protein S16 [Phycisphaerae bacterium]HPP24890.1 30S ribosomal protein S16 [Phycisphaerae bacterium]